MSELEVLDTAVEPLTRVEFSADGRVKYTDGRLRCLYPSEADTTEYVVAVFNVESGTVELPDGAAVLSIDEGVVVAAVPASEYGVSDVTVDLHPDTVAKAKRRNGDAADRPEAIDTAVNCDQLGYGKGLVGESYDGYPTREELSNPDSGEFLRSLLEHPKVEGLDDAVDELTGANTTAILGDWLATVEAACDIHSLDVDTLLAKGGNEGGDEPLKAVLGYSPPEAVVG